jgi:hypothetical protein
MQCSRAALPATVQRCNDIRPPMRCFHRDAHFFEGQQRGGWATSRQHGNRTQGHENNAQAVDQPVAALPRNRKARGLLAEALGIRAGEFGRTPFAQGATAVTCA